MALIAIFHLLFVCFLPAATRSSDASGAPQLQFIDCSTADNYTATDAYAANLNQLLAALPTNTVSKNGGFFNTTVGQGAAATVYGLALCPVDFSRSDCNDCLTAASSSATGLVKRCPGSVTVSAIFDQCMLRYSNKKLSGIAETDIKFTLTGAMVATRQAYSDSLKQGLAYLSAEAATSPERFAASTTAPYALVQCTWDLPPDKCKACIDTLSANASDLFAVGIDGERKSYSCRVRYSNSSFTVVPLVVPTGHPSSSDKNTNKAVVAGAVIGTLIAVGSIIILFFFCVARKRRYERLPKEHDVLEHILDGAEGPRDLPLEILRDITEDFSEQRKIGQGGFGEVYKGVLRNGSVAVKRITVNTMTVDDTQFYNEVKSLLKIIDHPNVVRFLGFCANTHHTLVEMTGEVHLANIKERLLCFEYISNKSLDKHITDELRGLEWNTRYQIIKGICNGLQYLHCVMNIIHMDLKPANIMVDDNMVPKITDFGLAILLDGTSPTTGDLCFTRRYCAPEYEKGGKATAKCDMYSLGVIIMELVTGRKDIRDKKNVERRWRHRLERSQNHTPLQVQQVTKCLQIAERCMKANPELRPSVSEIPILLQVELQKISSSSDDDILGIEPLELRFAFEPNKEISHEVELTNETGNYVAFNVNTTESKLHYCAEPNKGIVRPQSKRTVKIILLQAQEMATESMPHADEFIVQSTQVAAADKEITEDMFNNECGNKVVDEVSVMVVI